MSRLADPGATIGQTLSSLLDQHMQQHGSRIGKQGFDATPNFITSGNLQCVHPKSRATSVNSGLSDKSTSLYRCL